MKFVSSELDKQKLLGFRLLKEGKSITGRLPGDKHIIGAKVGVNGKGGQPQPT